MSTDGKMYTVPVRYFPLFTHAQHDLALRGSRLLPQLDGYFPALWTFLAARIPFSDSGE